jgi:hypothetical protein
MKCEPLKNKKQKMKKDILSLKEKNVSEKSEFYLGYKKGIDDSFEVFASFVDQFKKYKNNVKLLMNEQKDVWQHFVKFYETQKGLNTSNYLGKYNSWLFEFLFDDLNNMDSNDFLSLFK